ncbi:glycosyltransferase family 2 protein [Patescibacteria group bacterium]
MKLALVLLSLNEIDGLKKIYKQIPKDSINEIFAVDGGSTDGTLDFYREHRVPVLKQRSRGRGEAFRQAMKESDADAFIFFSPDGNEDPNDIPKFRDHLNNGFDMVIASRMMKGAFNEEDNQLFKWRKWANNAFNWLANISFRKQGPYICDTINGFRAIKKDAFQIMNTDGQGHTIEYQTTIRSFKKGLKVKEFPTYEGPRIGGEIKAKSIPTGIRFIKMYLKELFTNRK